jgi:NADH dehydrogenase FAD-containing subunit
VTTSRTAPQRLVILGAGTGGTLAANRLRKKGLEAQGRRTYVYFRDGGAA